MKNFKSIIAILILAMGASMAFADEPVNNKKTLPAMYASAGIGSITMGGGELDYHTTVGFDLAVGILPFFNNTLGLEVNLGLGTEVVDEICTDRATAIRAYVIKDFPILDTKFKPFVGAGFGVVIYDTKYEHLGTITEAVAHLSLTTGLNYSITNKIDVGARFNIEVGAYQNIEVQLCGRYNF